MSDDYFIVFESIAQWINYGFDFTDQLVGILCDDLEYDSEWNQWDFEILISW